MRGSRLFSTFKEYILAAVAEAWARNDDILERVTRGRPEPSRGLLEGGVIRMTTYYTEKQVVSETKLEYYGAMDGERYWELSCLTWRVGRRPVSASVQLRPLRWRDPHDWQHRLGRIGSSAIGRFSPFARGASAVRSYGQRLIGCRFNTILDRLYRLHLHNHERTV